MALLATGSKAPEFSLSDDAGEPRKLSEFLAKGPVVVYFYPKDDTPGCTAEACKFRDDYEDFVSAGAEVVGISSDGGSSHRAFKDKHRLPFVLLSDPDAQVARSFGVKKVLGLLPGRATFVLDQQGLVQLSFSSQLNMHAHVNEALETIRRISKR